MSEFYSNIYKNKSFKNDYDVIVGHFSGEDASFPGSPDCVFNLDKLSGRVCLGHIHTRDANPKRYLGSVFAGKVNENDYTRAAWVLDGNKWSEEKLPIFDEFITVTYPDPLPKARALTPIYTVLKCGSEIIAKEKYGNIYIKKVTLEETDSSSKEKLEINRQFNSIKDMDIKKLFDDFSSNQKPPFSESVLEKSKKALEVFFQPA